MPAICCIDQIEQWLFALDLPALNAQEARFLMQLEDKENICEVFDILVQICQKRYAHNTFWPDFTLLNLSCALPEKPMRLYDQIFAIGLD